MTAFPVSFTSPGPSRCVPVRSPCSHAFPGRLVRSRVLPALTSRLDAFPMSFPGRYITGRPGLIRSSRPSLARPATCPLFPLLPLAPLDTRPLLRLLLSPALPFSCGLLSRPSVLWPPAPPVALISCSPPISRTLFLFRILVSFGYTFYSSLRKEACPHASYSS
jgi:hypothetical protein